MEKIQFEKLNMELTARKFQLHLVTVRKDAAEKRIAKLNEQIMELEAMLGSSPVDQEPPMAHPDLSTVKHPKKG